MDNSAKSRDTKDNKYWISILIYDENGKAITEALKSRDDRISDISWLPPLNDLRYKQYRLYREYICEKLNIKREDRAYLPMNHPFWDAIGIYDDTIILVAGVSSYYLIGSTLSYFNKIKSRGYKAKLVLLNIINYQTHIPAHYYDNSLVYKRIFIDMYGRMDPPQDVIILDYDIT